MAFRHSYLFLCGAVLLAACETVVDVAAPAYEPQLVAHSFFTPDSLWVVRVSRTAPYAGQDAPMLVEDASVEVWAGERLVARPLRADSGTYVAAGEAPAPGQPYMLRVSAPGYPATEGSDALPAPVPVVDFQETPITVASNPRRKLRRVAVTLADPPGVSQYYGVLVVQVRRREDRRTGQVTPLPPTLFTFESDDVALGEGLFDPFGSGKTSYREAFFTDGLFDGRLHTFDFDVQYDEPAPDADVVIQRAFVVVLLSVSETFFRHWETADGQAFANENPFAEPLRVYSNMTAGLGVFAGLRYRLFPLTTAYTNLIPRELCFLLSGSMPLCTVAPAG